MRRGHAGFAHSREDCWRGLGGAGVREPPAPAGKPGGVQRRRQARLHRIGAGGVGGDAEDADQGDDGEGQEHGDGAPAVEAQAPPGA